ncbi:MAG: Unknown protein [uncultured Thiotrichaceae bacterium]|uniref:O-antigen ligase-related domain-containing protein n=1 Tax=uncultured Thiotrichaceae bacterium TaxID=298394 RepID=A0A6S6TKV1_9GAMM|nr:MAG: Unknown protein [uncultured Thiotrichaceae bacterium]
MNMHFSFQYTLTALVLILLTTYPLVGGMEVFNMLPWVEATALITLSILIIGTKDFSFINKRTWAYIALILVTPLIFLIPIPFSVFETLPGYEIYAQIITWVSQNGNIQEPTSLPISLVPYRTEHAFLYLIPPITIFLILASINTRQKILIIYAILFIAFCEASLALIQFSSGSEYFFFGIPQLKPGIAYGTYQNADHLVFLFAMSLPISIALLFAELNHKHYRQANSSNSILKIIIFSMLIVIFIIGALVTGSRAGIALTFLAGYLAYLTFSRRNMKKKILFLLPALVIVFLGISTFLDLTPVLNLFLGRNPLNDGRWLINVHTWEGIQAFFPIGSGPGTYPEIYRIFQPPEQIGFINHAHNDFLEIIFETGVLGIALILIGLYLLLSQSRKIPKRRLTDFQYLQKSTGIGILIFLLHSILDFNMHDPLNVLFFASILGVFYSKPKFQPQANPS